MFSPQGQLKVPVSAQTDQPSALSFHAKLRRVEEDRAVNDFEEMAMDIGRHALIEVHRHCKDSADAVITSNISIAKEPEIVDVSKVHHGIEDTSVVHHELELVAQPTPFRTTVLELAAKGLVSPNLLQALLKMGGRQLRYESV